MGRKSLSRLAVDIGGYVTGRGEIPLAAPPGDLGYPIDWRFTLARPDYYYAPFDRNGLPMKRFESAAEPVYLPSRLASWALAHWTKLEEGGGSSHHRDFLKAAEWFAAEPDGLYYHTYEMPAVGARTPWLSALSQGQAVSVLVRAHALTGDRSFLDVARAAATPLRTPLADGGVVRTLAGVGPFLEEYPGSAGTLNGCLLAIAGLDDLIACDAGNPAIDLRGELIETVADQAEAWERRGWSLYNHAPVGSSVVPNFNTVRYHRLHIRLLDHFARCTDDHRLAASATRTRAAMDRLGVRLLALGMKTRYRLRAGW